MADEYLVVGAGFTGAVMAERLASAGSRVLVIDRRDHVAGNAHDTRDENGLLYHVYGPHIFHTNSAAVWTYLSRFTDWRAYEHRVLGQVDGRHVPIPFNLTSIEILFERAEAERLKEALIGSYGFGSKVSILKLRESEVGRVRELADFIYEKVFLGYSRKQWGLDPSALSPSVLGRVPVHVSYDDRYFQDRFQGIPAEGYTRLVERILDHPAITVSLATDLSDIASVDRFRTVIHTGEIDAHFGYRYGPLPYRTLTFDMRLYRQRQHQAVAQINYPNDHAFTRITEMAHLTGEWSGQSLVAIEYPDAHVPGLTTPYYPIPNDANHALHKRYLELAAREAPHLLFAGRLGDYRYYNMDQAVAAALATADRLIEARGEARPLAQSPA